jgi:hypothetical protein
MDEVNAVVATHIANNRLNWKVVRFHHSSVKKFLDPSLWWWLSIGVEVAYSVGSSHEHCHPMRARLVFLIKVDDHRCRIALRNFDGIGGVDAFEVASCLLTR